MKIDRKRLIKAQKLLMKGHISELIGRLKEDIYSHQKAFGLRRDIRVPLAAPEAKVPIKIRKIAARDANYIFEEGQLHLEKSDIIELRHRHRLFEVGIPTCYVAINELNNEPCFMQWLIGPENNDSIQLFFGAGYFPTLRKDEALLEGAYTPSQYRGQGIMAAAMARIAEHATELGCCHAITFVGHDNAASLRGCKKAGFSPYTYRTVTRAFYGLVDKPIFTADPTLGTSEI